MSQGPTRTPYDRRRFLIDSARLASATAIVSMGLASLAKKSQALPATAFRPPGALPEEAFTSACIRCGLCVRDCPYPTLDLAKPEQEVATGTPYFVARDYPCEMCEDLPCVAACPTGALDHGLTDITEARMGLAHVVDQESCIAFQGLRCEVCFNVCPVRGEAITLEMRHNPRSQKHAMFVPVVHSDACTGCGKCEHACILEEAAIKVLPLEIAKGKMQSHYRLGWEEKNKAGESLVTPDTQHQFNLPEGMEYDYYGKGLIEEPEQQATPFSSNPLDTLNRKEKPDG